jgi:PKD repeat protein
MDVSAVSLMMRRVTNMRSSSGVHSSALRVGTVLFLFFLGTTGLEATNAIGFIQSNGWLALGPFSEPFGCSGKQADFLTPHIAPSKIEDQAPNVGDEVEYDIDLASTTSYNGPAGPSGLPTWRVFDEGDVPADDLDLDADALKVGSPSDDVCTFLATYFRYAGPAPVEVVLCTNSDDGVQVWMDRQLAVNNNACRGRSLPPLCQDNARVTIQPGLHRIILGVWERAGGFGGSLGLKKDGIFITDADAEWEFTGTDSQGFAFPAPKVTVSQTSGVEPFAVEFDASGSTSPRGSIVSYSWDFGDGQTGTGAKASHTYSAGIYTFRLTVTNDKGVSDTIEQLITVSFSSQSVAPWQSADVGNPVMAGGERPQGDCMVVFAGGLDISKSSDQFHYVYQERSGNISLTMQLKEASWQSGGRVGPMLRESLGAASPFAFMDLQYLNNKIRPVYISRLRQGGTASKNVSAGASALTFTPPNAHLRLEKNGSDFIGSSSSDGQTWVEVWRETVTGGPDKLLSGLALTAGDSEARRQSARVTLCQIDLQGGAPPAGPNFHRGDSDDNGQLQLTDAVRILGFLFLGGTPPPCLDAADTDDNGQLQLTDAVRILGYLFLGGAAPPPPGPPTGACGLDPGEAHLGCQSYTQC